MEKITIKQMKEKIGQKVKIEGWVSTLRELGGVCFLLLRQRQGTVQIVLTKEQALGLTPESVVSIIGIVKEEQRAKLGCEITAETVTIISHVKETLPIILTKGAEISFPTLLKFRPISLRIPTQQAIFKIQAELIWAFREFMKGQEFTEIHSTKLCSGGLEGGSAIFEVKYFEKKAYLAQSPQFYKQMMVGVFERVFEVGKVYRAEPHATTRHLAEYIGLDFEMGFIESVEEIMAMEEAMFKFVFEHISKSCEKELALFGAKVPSLTKIPRIPFKEAISMIEAEHGKEFTREGLTPETEKLICELIEKKYGSELVFITKYPLAERPFYAMPSKEEGESETFELLYKGLEITTGGQRIHEYEMLVKAIESRGMPSEAFESYLMCFKFGMPVHGGLGIGTERVIKQLLGLSSVQETSLIPRTKETFLH